MYQVQCHLVLLLGIWIIQEVYNFQAVQSWEELHVPHLECEDQSG